jgi:hypothetical protein
MTLDKDIYGTMIAMPWQNKTILKDEMFDPDEFETNIELLYFDIPILHEFGQHGNDFFLLLAKDSTDIELFNHKSICFLIDHKWQHVGWFVRYC